MIIKNLFKSIYALIIGHLTIFKHSFRKRVTLEYPEVKPDLTDKFRGKHTFNIDKCKGCGICKRVCPADAINIVKENGIVSEYSIDYKKCIFCGNCAYYCNFNCINMSNEFELASVNKSDLIVKFTKVEDKNE